MRSPIRIASIALVLVCAGMSQPLYAQETIASFALQEELGQAWSQDLVTFPLEQPLSQEEAAKLTLLTPEGRETAFQLLTEEGDARLAFLADLPAYGKVTYRLVRREPTAPPAAALRLERRTESLRIRNGVTGVEVPTEAGPYQDGPLLGIRLRSGSWVGGSRLTTKRAIEGYTAQVLAQGPVFAELECRYRFAEGKNWTLRLRVIAGEPVVLIHETFDLGDNSNWEFLASRNFSPNYGFKRPADQGPYTMFPLQFDGGSSQMQLCPWDTWWDNRDALFLGLFSAPPGVTYGRDAEGKRLVRTGPAPTAPAGDDMLLAAAGDVAAWARSGPEVWDYAPGKFVPIKTLADGQVAFQLQLAAPGRRWLLGAGSVEETLVADGEVAPAQRLMNRYCETPLDSLKDMPLHWERTATYPHLVLNADEVKRLVASPDFDTILARNPTSRELKRVLFPAIAGQGFGDDAASVQATKEDLLGKLEAMVSYFTYGNRDLPAAMFGTFIPRLDLGYVLPPMDFALGTDLFTPEEQERIFAQLAFVAAKIYSPDYVSPGRSLGGNPNMVTAWAASLVMMACMLPDHPNAQAWYQEGMGRLDHMLDTWQGPKGGWLEAPHYQMAALDPIFLAKAAAANSGFLEKPFDERLLRTVLFLAKISTPPDPRFGDLRHYPPLGNTYQMETSEMFGAMAKLCRAQEPEKAAALQWTWQQQGKPHWIGLGGDAMLDYYRELLADEDWNPPAPAWTSEQFPGFGAVLRAGFPGERETYMVYHQGAVAVAHYDYDQGSFELWGKGQPLCLDWGYRGRAPAWQHNRMDLGGDGKVLAFSAQPPADYVHGRQDDGSWDRQILFVKDADPLGPNYFLFRESTTGTGTADWRLWINTRKDAATEGERVQTVGPVVHASGEHDVDLDIWFAPPAGGRLGELKVEDLTVATVRGFLGGGWSGWDEGKLTQTGLQLAQPRGEPLVTLLYPRLRTEQAPLITALAEGQGVKVEHPLGTDYVFLSLEPCDVLEGQVSFKGTAGTIQVRGEQIILTLSAPGEIAYGKARLVSATPATQTFQAQ